MRCVLCRVNSASVEVDAQTVGSIGIGLLVYVGVLDGDTQRDVQWTAEKLCTLRLFNDPAGKINCSLRDVGGSLLLIPNFTLAGDSRKGTRPSFTDAALPEYAEELFNALVNACAETDLTHTGRFGAHMKIDAQFDGPVTVIIDSPES